MPNELAKQFLELFEQSELPETSEITEENRKIYMRAHDVLLMYRGHPDTLMQSFRIFLSTNVRAFVYAGMARIVLMASYMSGGEYEQWGVLEGYKLLKIAQELAPYQFEIDMIEPEIYNMLKEHKKMRECLDELISYPHAPTHFRYAIAELWYWESQNYMPEVQSWCKQAQSFAENDIQKLYAINKLAGVYLGQTYYKQAVELYQHVVKIDPNDPWAWHNMSIIYWRTGYLERALDCNRRALQIMEFGVAASLQANLVERLRQQRHDDNIDEAPPYKMAGDSSGQGGFLKKLLGN